jgi:hypothetical protein
VIYRICFHRPTDCKSSVIRIYLINSAFSSDIGRIGEIADRAGDRRETKM